MFKGVVKDCFNKSISANISVSDSKTGSLLNKLETNSATGKYLMILPKGGSFNIEISADGFENELIKIRTRKDSEYKENEKDIILCSKMMRNDCRSDCGTVENLEEEATEEEFNYEIPEDIKASNDISEDKKDKTIFAKSIKEVEYVEGDFKVKKYIVQYDEYDNDVYMVKKDLITKKLTFKKITCR